ncbi:MAG: trehalose-phosphatase [Planctomycetaceae bacterium]
MSLQGVRERLASAAVLCDFDGVLAPIVPLPEDARPLPGFAEALAALAPRVRTLAVVTGRPSSFVRAHLRVPRLEVAGLYGLEGAPPVDEGLRAAVAAAAAGEPGARVEDKEAALAVHLREAPDPAAAADRLRDVLAAAGSRAGLVLREGKRVLELAPPGRGKGAAVLRLAQGADALLVAGDDLADLDAFDAADELADSGLVVCRVVVGGPETPTELVARADLVVEGPSGFLEVLRSL